MNASIATPWAATRAISRAPTPPVNISTLPATYVHPGQVVVSSAGGVLSTILGSCVAVCLHDAQQGLGGLNHYLLPTGGAEADAPGRYGPTAIDELVHLMVARGARREQMVAYIVGGASVLAAFNSADHLGLRNVGVARGALAQHRIPVIGADVGGTRGRKLLFTPRDGQVHVKLIGA